MACELGCSFVRQRRADRNYAERFSPPPKKDYLIIRFEDARLKTLGHRYNDKLINWLFGQLSHFRVK